MWWLKIHRWLGLALLVPMAALGLTGSMLVWPEWTEALANPERRVEAGVDPAAFETSDLANARQALASRGPIASLDIGAVGEPLIATAIEPVPQGERGRPVRHSVYLDPGSGAIIDTQSSRTSLGAWAHDIHGQLLIGGGWGRPIVGAMGIFLIVSGITGLVVFWPGRARFVAGLKWQKRDGKALNIHRQSGVILSLVVIFEAFTGVWISYPAFFASLVEPGVEQPERRRGGGPQEDVQPVDDAAWVAALRRAQAVYQGRPARIEAPAGPAGSWMVTFAGETTEVTGKVPVAAGAVTVEEKAIETGPPPAQTRAGVIASWMRQTHYATIGGAVWEWLVFLSGLVLTFLSCSGIYVWAKRSLRRRRLLR